MSKYSLAITLGHNSSAILIEDGNILIGYENERLSKIKSDSHFPSMAISRIGKYYDLSCVKDIYVSHWETFGNVDEMSPKHWSRQFLSIACPNAEIHASEDHHDCHAAISSVFSGPTTWQIVADGFGNYNEVLSIYKRGQLIHRVFGYEKSLGLLYQYVTDYLGLKMNQDEFKLLGYESKIDLVVSPETKSKIIEEANILAIKYYNHFIVPEINPVYDAVAGLHSLVNIRMDIFNTFNTILYKKIGYIKSKLPDNAKKVICSYIVQRVVETVITSIVRNFKMDSVALSGGLFMNVKLNNAISKIVRNISVLPICGDQGAGLGAYHLDKKDLKWPGHLYWGKRDLSNFSDNNNLLVFRKVADALVKIDDLLLTDAIVNVVYGDMEFGARALCHTTTFALPTVENVKYINHLNDRSTIMPMAGVITKKGLDQYKGHESIDHCLEYMICTVDHISNPETEKLGCHHFDADRKVFTNRIQLLTKDNVFYNLVDRYEMLINTSFNIHGQPIVFSEDDIIKAHTFQSKRDHEERVFTVIIQEKLNVQ